MVEDWRATYPTTPVTVSADVPVAIAFDRVAYQGQPNSPNFAFVAGRKVYANGNSTYTIVKYNLDGSGGLGTIAAEVEWPPVTGSKATFRALVGMAVMDFRPFSGDPASGVFVTGLVEGEGGTTDWLTVGYTRDLALLWTAQYNNDGNLDPPATPNDVPVAIAVGEYEFSGTQIDRRVIVTGTTQSMSGGTDIVTVVYDAETGAQKYVRQYSSPGIATDLPAGVVAWGDIFWVVGTEPSVAGRRLRVFCYDLANGTPRLYPSATNPWVTPTNPGLVLSLPNHHLDAVGVAVTDNTGNAWVGATATPITPTLEGKNMAFARVPADNPPAQNSAPEVFDSEDHYDDVATCVAVGAVPGTTIGPPKHNFCIAGYSVVPGEGKDIQAALYFQQGGSAILERWRASFRRFEHDDDDEAVVVSMSGPSSSPPAPGQPPPDLDVFLAGRTKNAAGFWDTVILKYDSNLQSGGGDKVWQWDQRPPAPMATTPATRFRLASPRTHSMINA